MNGRQSKHVMVIGSRGVLGALTRRAFSAAGWQVRAASRHPGPGESFIDLDRVDVIAAALEERELVVTTVPHPALLLERLVLEHGGVLINTSSLPAAAGRALRAIAGGAAGTVLMNAGLAPGVTAVVAADLLRGFPEADTLEIVFTVSTTTARGPASVEFIRRSLTALNRHRTLLVRLPEPFGERPCVGFGESDAGWMGALAEGRAVRPYICFVEPEAHEHMLELNHTGAMTTSAALLVTPRPLPPNGRASREPVAHWIAATRGGRRLAVRTVECRGEFLHAARSTVAFADAIRRAHRSGGCFDPEEICTLREIEPTLRAAGIAVVRHTPA